MKKILILALMMLLGVAAQAQDKKTYENRAFSIKYPADWEITWDSYTFVNMASADEKILFDVSFNDEGPMKSQLQETVENWVLMKQGQGHKVDQKLVKEDYALVRSIETDKDSGKQTVVVWFLMISSEPQCFSGSIQSDLSHANEALDILVDMLATLSPK